MLESCKTHTTHAHNTPRPQAFHYDISIQPLAPEGGEGARPGGRGPPRKPKDRESRLCCNRSIAIAVYSVGRTNWVGRGPPRKPTHGP